MDTSISGRVSSHLRTAVLVSLLTAVGCTDRLQEFTSEEGRFRVRTPAPLIATDDALPTGVHLLRRVQRHGTLTVAWEDLVERADRNADDTLDLACNSAVERLKGKVAARSSITLHGSHPGRELLVEWPNQEGVVRLRVYLVDHRLYQVMASGERRWVESSPAQPFLASFEVIEE